MGTALLLNSIGSVSIRVHDDRRVFDTGDGVMRIIMMGTGPFAVPLFRSLLASDHSLLALVTRPSVLVRTRGKSKAPPNPMREVAESHGLPVLAPPDINTDAARRELSALRSDLLVVCDYGQILTPETLAVAALGGINLHGSLLPKYRGAAPIQWALWNGDAETGVTVIHMTPRLDGGPCLARRATPIGPLETAVVLEPRLAQLGVAAVWESIELLARWDRVSPLGHAQDPTQATRAPRMKKTDGNVDWSRSASEIFNQYRAVQPWPGLFTYLFEPGREPARVILEQVHVASARDCQSSESSAIPRGSIIPLDNGELTVAAGQGRLSIDRLQLAGGRPQSPPEFLRGHPLPPEARFGPAPTVGRD